MLHTQSTRSTQVILAMGNWNEKFFGNWKRGSWGIEGLPCKLCDFRCEYMFVYCMHEYIKPVRTIKYTCTCTRYMILCLPYRFCCIQPASLSPWVDFRLRQVDGNEKEAADDENSAAKPRDDCVLEALRQVGSASVQADVVALHIRYISCNKYIHAFLVWLIRTSTKKMNDLPRMRCTLLHHHKSAPNILRHWKYSLH